MAKSKKPEFIEPSEENMKNQRYNEQDLKSMSLKFLEKICLVSLIFPITYLTLGFLQRNRVRPHKS
jgi:hypothetical protein